MHPADPTSVLGRRLAGYRLRHCLGRGPTGAVYAAVHPVSGHKVAIKLIPLDQDQDYGSTLWLERVGARLTAWRHPGVIPVLKVGRQEAMLYIISEYARGRSLAQLLATSGPLSEANARPLLEPLAAVLASAAGQGLVHGGLGQHNVWLTPREAGSWPPLVRVMDFGLALLRCPAGRHHPDPDAFFAPELRSGAPPGNPADIYSWGMLAYQLLCGHLPWEASVAQEIWQLQQQGAAIPPSVWANLTPQTEALLLRTLDPDPAQRPSADELLAALSALPDAPAARCPPRRLSEAARALPAEAPLAPPVRGQRARPTARVSRLSGPPPCPRAHQGGRLVWGAASALLLAALLISGGLRLALGLWPWALAAPVPAQTARLTVISDPPGASVFIDGQQQTGTTPFTLEGIPQGRPYEVLVHHPGYRSWQQRVALGLDEHERVLQAALSKGPARWGSLVLQLSDEADVFLDGRRVGSRTGQLTLAEVRAGVQHQLRVSAPGRLSVEQVVEVEAGKVKVLHVKLESAASARRGS